jgi:hypothetical protein
MKILAQFALLSQLASKSVDLRRVELLGGVSEGNVVWHTKPAMLSIETDVLHRNRIAIDRETAERLILKAMANEKNNNTSCWCFFASCRDREALSLTLFFSSLSLSLILSLARCASSLLCALAKACSSV